jgi:hypothetical protein
MRKVLLVGLGGSGGKTLSYLMDELLSDLKERTNEAGERWQLDRLPACWSFVHIDVPATEGDLGKGSDKSVTGQGGKYVPLGDGAGLYPTFDDGVYSKFKDASPFFAGLGQFSSWRPSPTWAAAIPIQFGAGAYRAVGRVLTLAKADVIHENLKSAVQKLYEVSSDTEGVQVSNILGFQYNQNLSPLVIFVSSMAGGSGASMILDVVDLLRSVTSDVPGFNANDTSAFLYTADVFQSLPGVVLNAGAGTLATVSELVSAAGRSSESWDEIEWRGLSRIAPLPPANREIGRGPKMVTPVGASSAGRAFGTTPNDVYRGFAKMLMPLVNDDPSQTNYAEHVVTNFASEVGQITGSFFAQKRDGSGNWPMFFSGYGNANLTMGLDRYREYAAQRLARQAAEILTRGHIPMGSPGGAVNQMVSQAAEEYLPTFLRVLGLEGEASGGTPFDASRVRISALRLGDAAQIIDEELRFYSSDFGRDGTRSSQALQVRFNQRQDERKRAASIAAKRAVLAWSEKFLKSVEEALLLVMSRYGLLVAEKMLEMLKGELNALSNTFLKKSADSANQAGSAVLNELTSLSKIKATVSAAKEGLGFTRSLQKLMRQLVEDAADQTLAQVISEFNSGVAPLLVQQMQNLRVQLEAELKAKRPATTSAAFREAPISQWPVDGKMPPPYFEPAINEVLLTSIEEYPKQFETHVSNWSGLSEIDGVKKAASEILLRREFNDTTNKFEKIKGWAEKVQSDSHPHLLRERSWNPTAIGSGVPQLPRYSLLLSAQDLRTYANSWVGVSGNPFEKHCREGISQWLAADSSREEIFVNQLRVAMGYAEPLVAVDSALVAIHQPNVQYGAKLNFSTVPIDASNAAIARIVNSLATSPNGLLNSRSLEAACQPASRATSIYITSSTPPISPWALKSLTAPVRQGYIQAREVFWKSRRARPLMRFIPLAEDSIESFLRGFILGRITGSVQFEVNKNDKSPLRVKVWSGLAPTSSGTSDWQAFSDRLLFAHASELGLQSQGPRDTTGWNIPAVLLESLPLALTNVDPGNTSDLDPYKTLINSGVQLKTLPIAAIQIGVRTEAEKWYSGELPFTSQVAGCSAGGDAGVAAADRYLKNLEQYTTELLGLNLQDQTVFDNLQAVFDIAPALGNAARSVRDEINSDLRSKSTSEESVTPVVSVETTSNPVVLESPEA